MSTRYLAIHDGFIGVADSFQPDWNAPYMSRTIWVSKHKWDVNADIWAMGSRIEAGASDVDGQHWSIITPTGSRVGFTTPVHGVRVMGVGIAKPRKRKGQAHPWRWEAGKWVNHSPNI